MSWLTSLSGFQLWVISAFLSIQANRYIDKADKSGKLSDHLLVVIGLVEGIAVYVVWWVYAAWPALT